MNAPVNHSRCPGGYETFRGRGQVPRRAAGPGTGTRRMASGPTALRRARRATALSAPSRLARRAPDSVKKSLAAAEQDRPDIVRLRRRWQRAQGQLDPRRLVFLGETWAKTHMPRRHGRCPRGQRLRATRPHGHWQTRTFVATLHHDRLAAPCVFDGPLNGPCFPASVDPVSALIGDVVEGSVIQQYPQMRAGSGDISGENRENAARWSCLPRRSCRAFWVELR